MKSRLSKIYYRARYSIGFYPTIISLAYFVFALVAVSLPSTPFWGEMKSYFVWVAPPKVWNAEVILSTLITGIISFITLSFAMVMVVLSNISTTYSPKLILGLITEKTHQFVLGNYVGSILYCLILLLAFPDGETHSFKNILVILAAAMGIWCLALFIYFIHSISTSVQINNIMEKVYNETKKELYKRRDKDRASEGQRQMPVDMSIAPRYALPARESGFLQKADTESLVKTACDHELVIRVYPHLGDFVVKDSLFLSCTKPLEEIDPSVSDRIYDAFTFFTGEKIDINEQYGFTQLMEIAVKALSPGINDPGTASICLDYLTDLFVLWSDLRRSDVYYDDNRTPRLIINSLRFEDLFTLCIGPIRRYGKNDLLIANKLIQSIITLSQFDREEKRHKEFLNQQAISVIEDIKNSSSNKNDLNLINGLILDMNEDQNGYFELPDSLISHDPAA